MEKKFYELSNLQREMPMGKISRSYYREDNANCPDCINTDFCVATPTDRNNGILTMAFVDMQPLESVYPQETAFCNGTLFPNLNKPFYGGKQR